MQLVAASCILPKQSRTMPASYSFTTALHSPVS
jgi:hypothetical protein